MRKAFVRALLDASKKNRNIILLTGDLGFNILEPFKDAYPDRFINVGVAEENLIGIAAGLATTKHIPFAYSIATFASMRAYEHIRNDVGIQNLPVKIVGIGGGLSYNKAGPTHHSLEDIALMRTIPGMTIIAPCNEDETYKATLEAVDHKGPVYLRLETNPLGDTHEDIPFSLSRAQSLRNGKRVAIITTGTKLPMAYDVEKLLIKKGIKPSIYAFPVIKPLDTKTLKIIASSHAYIATIEEHRVDGGLGTAILETVESFEKRPRVLRFGLLNEFPKVSASYPILLKTHGLTATSIAAKILKNF